VGVASKISTGIARVSLIHSTKNEGKIANKHKMTKNSIPTPSRIYPSGDFWYENIPSSKPETDVGIF
jgi:hypothetical protein